MSLYMQLPTAGVAATFPSEDLARARLCKVRWPDGIVCAVCESKRIGQKTTRDVFKCGDCGHHVSATAGTALNSTNIPVLLWLLAAEEYISRQASGRTNMLTNANFRVFLGTKSNDTVVRVKKKLKADLEPAGTGMLLACVCLMDGGEFLHGLPNRDDYDALFASVGQRSLASLRR